MSAGAIEDVAVLGLGTMGHGIAQTFAVAGCRVRAYDIEPGARENLLRRVRSNLERLAAAGLVETETIPAILERLTVCDTERDAVEGAAFITEAVREDLALKRELFRRVEGMAGAETILASNTSSYPMTDIATGLRRPERAVNTHWFNPPHIVPVVEVVPGERTSDETARRAHALLERVGKLPVRVNREIPGFLVNRVQVALFREVWDLLDRGIASAEDIDRAIRGSMGLRLAAFGPLAIIDFAGWDVTARVFENLIPDMRSDGEIPGSIRRLLEEGRSGVKSGAGVYDYPPGTGEKRVAERDRLLLRIRGALEESAGGGA